MITTIITTSNMSMNSCKTKGVWGGEACFKSKMLQQVNHISMLKVFKDKLSYVYLAFLID